MNMFEHARASEAPLAALMRPLRLRDVLGQTHLTDPDSSFARRVSAGRLGSIVLHGPPGVGKTSIGRAVGAEVGKEFRSLHGATSGVKDIARVVDEARVKSVLLFVDEVHRFSSSQQDHLLAICEEGVLDLVSATTSNPFHALTSAMVSRSTFAEVKPIDVASMLEILRRGIARLARSGTELAFAEGVLEALASRAGGDARRALTALESVSIGRTGRHAVGMDAVDDAYAGAPIRHDAKGDSHYDVTSAFVKSLRGSDPDAALYWLARLIHGGEPPEYIARRLIVHASEDIGLADNTALVTATAALQAVLHVGYPEARIVLAHAALHICRAPKSNSAYSGISRALAMVENGEVILVPNELRDGHYAGARQLGVGGYASPHRDPRGWTEFDYAPGVARGSLYRSDARGPSTFEARADAYWESVTGAAAPKEA